MVHWIRSFFIEMTGVAILGLVMYMVFAGGNLSFEWGGDHLSVPPSLLSLNTIFLSILIEAIPFVLIGVLISGAIQIFVTISEDGYRRTACWRL